MCGRRFPIKWFVMLVVPTVSAKYSSTAGQSAAFASLPKENFSPLPPKSATPESTADGVLASRKQKHVAEIVSLVDELGGGIEVKGKMTVRIDLPKLMRKTTAARPEHRLLAWSGAI